MGESGRILPQNLKTQESLWLTTHERIPWGLKDSVAKLVNQIAMTGIVTLQAEVADTEEMQT